MGIVGGSELKLFSREKVSAAISPGFLPIDVETDRGRHLCISADHIAGQFLNVGVD